MDAQEFIELLEAPEKAKEKGIDELKKLAHDFPYSQPIQLMYAIRLRKSSEHLFNQQLGRASILTNDRSVLFDLFEQGGKSTLTEEEETEILHPKPDLPEHFTPTASPAFSPAPNEIEEENQHTTPTPEEKETDTVALPIKKHEIVNEQEENVEEEYEENKDLEEQEKEEDTKDKEASKKERPRQEKNIEALPADQRIRAILEKNRQLREEFESRKQKDESPLSEMDLRLQKIRERLSELKQPQDKSAEKALEKDWSEKLPAAPEPAGLEAAEADEQSQEIAKENILDTAEGLEQEEMPKEIALTEIEEDATIEPIDFRIESDETDEYESDEAKEQEEVSKPLNIDSTPIEEESLLEEETVVHEHQQEPDYNALIDGALEQETLKVAEETEASDTDLEAHTHTAEFDVDKSKEEDVVLEEVAQVEEHKRYEDDTIRLVERADAEDETEQSTDEVEQQDTLDLQEVLNKESHVVFSVDEDTENAGELEREAILQEKSSSEEAELMLVELADKAEDVAEKMDETTSEDNQEEEENGDYESEEDENFDPQRDKYRLTPLDLDENLIKDVVEHKMEEKMSFSDWLKKLNKGGGSSVERVKGNLISTEEILKPAAFEEKVQLLDSFVEKLPTLKKKRIEAGPAITPIAIGNLVNKGETASLVTETLAGVYTEQRHYDKAIKAYEILKLKYPEKSSFFAARISDVKKLKNNK